MSVVLADDTAGYDARQDRIDVRPMDIQVEFGNMYAKEIESFSQSILTGEQVEVTVEDALMVQRVVEAAYASSQKGVFVDLEDEKGKGAF